MMHEWVPSLCHCEDGLLTRAGAGKSWHSGEGDQMPPLLEMGLCLLSQSNYQ